MATLLLNLVQAGAFGGVVALAYFTYRLLDKKGNIDENRRKLIEKFMVLTALLAVIAGLVSVYESGKARNELKDLRASLTSHTQSICAQVREIDSEAHRALDLTSQVQARLIHDSAGGSTGDEATGAKRANSRTAGEFSSDIQPAMTKLVTSTARALGADLCGAPEATAAVPKP